MNERRIWRLGLTVMAVVGLLASVAFAMHSLGPSALALANRPGFSTHDLRPAQFKYESVHPESTSSGQVGADVLLMRLPDGQLRAWWVPVLQGQRRLPDGQWWRAGVPCPVFGPDWEQGELRCLHGNLAEFFRTHYRWSLSGKPLSPHAPHMLSVEGCEVEGRFLIGERAGCLKRPREED